MKKLIILITLAFTALGYSQAEFEKIAITENTATAETSRIVSQQPVGGELNYINAIDLPVSTAVRDSLQKKQNLPTGFIQGLNLSIDADPTKFNIAAGVYCVTDFSDLSAPVVKFIAYGGATGVTPTYLNTNVSSYVALDKDGVIIQQTSPFTNAQRRTLCIVGNIVHSNLTNINVVNEIKAPIVAPTNQLHDLMRAIGAFNIRGNVYGANGANMKLDKTAGDAFAMGINPHVYTDPHVLNIGAQTALTFRYRTQTGAEGSDVSDINPNLYDNAGTLTAVSSNKFTIQRINLFQSGATRIQYGQNLYNSLSEALAGFPTATFVTESNIADNSIFRAYLVVKEGTANLSTAISLGNAKFIPVDKFGNTVSGGSIALTFANIVAALGYTPADNADLNYQGVYDNSTTALTTTTAGKGAVTVRRGSASDSDNILVGQNGAGTNTFLVTGSGNMGLNQLVPEASLHMGNGNAILLDRYKNGLTVAPNFIGRAYNGTKASPTTILDNEDIGIFGAIPYNGIDAENVRAWIKFKANGNQSGSNRGTKVDISITPLNALSPARSVLNSDNDRVLIADASVVNGIPVSIGWHGKGEIAGENPHRFQVVSDGLNPTVSMGNFGGIGSAGNAGGHLWSSRGTATSPTAIQSGDYLWSWGFRGQGTTTRAPSSANMSVRATENFTDTTHGTEILFGTNETGHDANLGRTSEFKMGADGVFSAEAMEVQSYSAGNLGSFRFKNHSPTDSRSWRIANDYDAFGDFAILQSTTQTGDTYIKRFSISPSGDVELTGAPIAPTPTTGTGIANKDYVDGIVNSNALLLTGNQSFTGIKTGTSTNSTPAGLTLTNEVTTTGSFVVDLYNSVSAGTNSTGAIRVTNSNTGGATSAIQIVNSSTGLGSFLKNLSTGKGQYNENVSTGVLAQYNSLTSSTGDLINFTKQGVLTAKVNSDGEFTVPKLIATGVVRLKSYTVATLPAGTQGDTAYVTDATAPTYLGTLTGGGSVVCPVFYNGTAWVSH